ncbi:MAG: helix-turn-helix domain-containing protein [Porphyrobacter sp.]|jgi:AraC-like DNA-binding protein|nr:helix-turn-helix domain-containing protein [Porphyrobacter sp.]
MGQAWECAQAAGLWSWSPQQWAWSPENPRWSLSLGLPKVPVYFDVSTDNLPPGTGYEMWRNLLYYSFEGDPLPPALQRGFSARTRCLISDPAQLLHYRSSAVSGRGVPSDLADDRETYTIGIVIAGMRQYEQAGANCVISHAGEFFVFDNRWHSRVKWSDHRAVQLSVPRADLEQRLGGRIPEPAVMMQLLENAHMGRVLKTQLQVTAEHMPAASEPEREFMLGQVMQLALFACETATANVGMKTASRTPARSDLFLSALRLIEQNISRPGFDVRALQMQLGCSRATLYRAFAEAGTSVSDSIAELRIAQAKALIARAPDMPVGLVAARCGWYDSASFARAFRRREGMSPSEFREQAHPVAGGIGVSDTI